MHPMSPKSWANFEQQGTQSILSSAGISSISDQGTGLSRFTQTTAFASSNYSYAFGTIDPATQRGVGINRPSGGTKSTTQFDVVVDGYDNEAFAANDTADASVLFLGTQ